MQISDEDKLFGAARGGGKTDACFISYMQKIIDNGTYNNMTPETLQGIYDEVCDDKMWAEAAKKCGISDYGDDSDMIIEASDLQMRVLNMIAKHIGYKIKERRK